jgi:hypothetical protein
MKRILAVALCATAFAAAAGPFDQVKGKMKPGLYDYKMTMEMPGMPAGMGGRPFTFQHCVTQKDIDEGAALKGKDPNQKDCEVKDFKMSGNTASYTMECKQNQMKGDVKMTFVENGFASDMKMSMNQGGQVMNMSQKMEGKRVGDCK